MNLNFGQWATDTFRYWKSEYTSQGVFDDTEIQEYRQQGYYVVYKSEEVCCPETDALIGYCKSISFEV